MKKILLILLCLPMIGFGQYLHNLDSVIRYSRDTLNNYQLWGKYKSEPTYDASNNMTLELQYYWNTSTNAWGESGKYERTYDASNNMTLELRYYWNTSTNAWKENSKYERTYDASNNNTLEIYYNWNTSTNAWEESSKYEHTYDANNNMTLSLSYSWNSNSWVNTSSISGGYYTTGICAYTLPDPGWAWESYSGHNAWINEMFGFSLIANTHPMYHVSSYDSARYYYSNSGITAIEDQNIVINNDKELLLITDLLGREAKKTNQPLFYIYDDGTVEKRIVID